jgi:hypothetical protein
MIFKASVLGFDAIINEELKLKNKIKIYLAFVVFIEKRKN